MKGVHLCRLHCAFMKGRRPDLGEAWRYASLASVPKHAFQNYGHFHGCRHTAKPHKICVLCFSYFSSSIPINIVAQFTTTSMQVQVVGFKMVKDPKVRVKGIKKLYEGLKIEKKYVKYVEHTNKHSKLLDFKVGDLVWIHLNKDIFMAWKFGRLESKVDGPFNIIEKIGENAYTLVLLGDYDILPTFNVKDLKSYHFRRLEDESFL